jgi:hypothetical protein
MSTADLPTDARRGRLPYAWATWLTGLLAGTDRCEWKPWYKAHYRFAKRPRTADAPNLDEWIRQHDAMVRARVGLLRQEGIGVTVENQNSFQLQGRTLILAGKPDIIASTTPPKVIDEKSGTPRPADEWQVLLYMWALPRVGKFGLVKTSEFEGELEYRAGETIAIPRDRLTPEASERIVTTLQMIGGPEPKRSPSAEECPFCDILACPDRIVVEQVSGETLDF